MANANLLKLTMLYINTFPEKHDQGDWVDPCESTMCFAGHAAILAGATFKQKIFDYDNEWCVNPETGKHVKWGSDKPWVYIKEFATNKLDLTFVEAEYLFHHNRTRAELEKAVEMLSEGYTVNYDGEFTKKEV